MQTLLFANHPANPQRGPRDALLPKDGRVDYYPEALTPTQSAQLFETLLSTLDWQADHLVMYGKKITTQRKVVWVGDPDCAYTYSGVKKQPSPWTPELLLIKHKAEALAHCQFNACLLNLYHNGDEAMGWHSDNEKELERTAPIASLSLGGIRKFAFKHKVDQTRVALFLENGSALIMHAPTQDFWQHSLLKTKQPVSARINLTFRMIRLDPPALV